MLEPSRHKPNRKNRVDVGHRSGRFRDGPRQPASARCAYPTNCAIAACSCPPPGCAASGCATAGGHSSSARAVGEARGANRGGAHRGAGGGPGAQNRTTIWPTARSTPPTPAIWAPRTLLRGTIKAWGASTSRPLSTPLEMAAARLYTTRPRSRRPTCSNDRCCRLAERHGDPRMLPERVRSSAARRASRL